MSAELPRDLYDAASTRELDRVAIEQLGIPGLTLMQRAGQAAYEALRERWPEVQRVNPRGVASAATFDQRFFGTPGAVELAIVMSISRAGRAPI